MNHKTVVNPVLFLSLAMAVTVSLVNPLPVVISAPIQEYPAGMVSYWKLNDGSGASASDSIGGNNGVVNGTTWTTGQVGGALSFDGPGDYVIVPNSSSLNPALITIESWIKLTGTAPSGGAALVEKDGWNGGQTGYAFVVGNWGTPNSLRFEILDPWRLVQSSTSLALNQWYHVAATYDGSTMRIFINGTLDSEFATSGPINVGNDGILGMGGRFVNDGLNTNETELYLPGILDSVAISNRALPVDGLMSFNGTTKMACWVWVTTKFSIRLLPRMLLWISIRVILFPSP